MGNHKATPSLEELGISPRDVERDAQPVEPPTIADLPEPKASSGSMWHRVKRWNSKFETITGLESRGIVRVPEDERELLTSYTYLQTALLWVSCNLTANGITLAMLGPLVFELGFTDAALCAVFGALIGCVGPAYLCTWGPRSGNRTMIIARYIFGRFSIILCLLTFVMALGYGTINCIITGQLLSAVNGHGLSLVTGIIIVAAISLLVAIFGMKAFHTYERFAWFPQLLILFVLVGSAGPHFDTSTISAGDKSTRIGHRVSFLALCLSSPIAWSACAADFFVYYPSKTPKRWLFWSTYLGNALTFCFCYLLGVGLASGITSNPSWANAYKDSQGALIIEGYSGLHTFGSFCGVVLALGIIADNIAATYSAALVVQMFHPSFVRVPRWVWTVVVVLVYTACALGGRDYLFTIFQNFLALMGYWTAFFVGILLEEQVLFRGERHRRARSMWERGGGQAEEESEHHDGFLWDAWNEWKTLPIGYAAFIAFLVGWAGAVVSMAQVWYVGPIAKTVGKDGGDLGLWVGFGLTLLVYPPLRTLEQKVFGR